MQKRGIMEITNTITNLFTPQGFAGFMEFLVIMLQFVYVIFAFLLTRQIRLMNISFKTPLAEGFVVLASFNFFASIGIVLLSIILL